MSNNHYDVAIIGAGTAGVAAAYAFYGSNKKVILIEKETKIGGTAVNASVRDWIEGCHTKYFEDVFNSLKRDGKVSGDLKNAWIPMRFSKSQNAKSVKIHPDALSEKYREDLRNYVDIRENTEFLRVLNKNENSVESIIIKQPNSRTEETISADYFIDCTSTGQLCRSAGATSRYGRDGRKYKNESIALDISTTDMNEPSLMFFVKKDIDDKEILDKVKSVYKEGEKIVKPGYIVKDGYFEQFPWKGDSDFIYLCNPMTGLGLKGKDVLYTEKGALYKDEKSLYEDAKKRVLEYWKYIKLESDIKKQNAIGGIPKTETDLNTIQKYGYYDSAPVVGIRESYRIDCEETLTQYDLCKKIDFNNLSDIVAVGTHPIDMHVTVNLDSAELKRFNNECLIPYGVSWRCMIPKNLTNVLVSGKSFGATQIAAASARTNMFMLQMGWASGNIIKYCLKNPEISDVRYISSEEIRKEHYINFDFYIANIEKYMDEKYYIPQKSKTN